MLFEFFIAGGYVLTIPLAIVSERSTRVVGLVVLLPAILLLMLFLGARWRRRAVPQSDGLRVYGLRRRYLVPWGQVESVSWSPYRAAYRSFVCAHVWVAFTGADGEWRRVAVGSARRNGWAQARADRIWHAIPDGARAGVALFQGAPVRHRQHALGGEGPIGANEVVVSRRDQTWGWVEGIATVSAKTLVFRLVGVTSGERSWRDITGYDIDVGQSLDASERARFVIHTSSGPTQEFEILRSDIGKLRELDVAAATSP